MILLRLNNRDLSSYIRVAHDEGLDPADSEFSEPQFSGSPAFAEGQAGLGSAASNREIVVPLILSADSSAGLHALIRDINGELESGARVEYATEYADQTTFFDLEAGRLDINYQYWIARNNTLRCELRLWTRPYGHTGTARILASIQATAAVQFPATGVLGDVDALGQLEVRVGSRVASGGRVIGYGLHRSASFSGIRGPSGPDFVAQSGATVRGGSGAIGSQFLALPVSPTTASGVALTSFLDPPAGHVGRHRVLGIMRSRLDRPIAITANDRWGGVLGPTAYASQVDGSKWGVVDLGEIQVPARRSGQEGVPTQYVELRAGGASGNVINASPALEVNRLIYLPLDEAPGMLRTPGAAGNSSWDIDDFNTTTNQAPLSEHRSAGGRVWEGNAGAIGLSAYGVAYAGAPTYVGPNIYSAPAPNATGLHTLGDTSTSGYLDDTQTEAQIILTGSYAAASPASIELRAKYRSASLGFALRFIPGPSQVLQLLSYSAAGASVMASAGIASTLASGIYLGQPHKLILSANGGELAGYLGTRPLAPIITASHADVTIPGLPALKMSNGSNVASGLLVADYFRVSLLGAGASDMGPRESFRFEAHPEGRVVQANASVFLADRQAAFRGVAPRVPAVGSPGPSGPAQMVVLSGDPTDFLGNDLMDVSLRVVDRFTFLR